MRKVGLVFIFTAVGFGLRVGGAPRIECDELEHDFGVVRNKEAVEHTFVLRNTGDAEVIINRVHATCGCTTTALKTDRIPPGGSLELHTRFSLEGRTGVQKKMIYVDSNDPVRPNLVLTLACDIKRDIEVEPSRIFFGLIQPGVATQKTAQVVVNAETPYHVTKADAVAGFFGVSFRPVEEGRRYEILFTLAKPEPDKMGTLFGQAVVWTDHPAFERIEIPVTAILPRDFVAVPRELLIPASAKDNALTLYAVLRSEKDIAFSVTGIEVPDNEIKVETEKLRDSLYRFRIGGLKYKPALDGKAVRIRIRTTAGEEKTFDFPLRPGPTSS
ncbi:MAG: DUF1573 domain-containing protein [Kiritimatiellia bacterium]